ncbi:hypothetical protein [Egbenema bharatensis]|uniref:hypothetical protein n=1 Tax=Egbenema bharatensis TaxID=3463334 RepID=UPI003A894238
MAPSTWANDFSATMRHTLKQPLAVSAILSLGAHIVLFATLPFLSNAAFSDAEPEIRRAVDLIELTPEEQSRLPDMSTPITLPPLFQDSLPDMSLLPVPDPTIPPPPPRGFLSEPLFPRSFSTPGTFQIPAVPPVPPPAPATPVQPQPPAPPVNAEAEAETSGEDTLPNVNLRRGRPLEDLLNGEIAVDSETEASENPQAAAPVEPPPVRSDEEIIAALQQDVRARQERIRAQQLLSYNPQGTAQDPNYDAGLSWFAWMESLIDEFGVDLSSVNPESNQFEQTTIAAQFPSEACGYINQTLSADYGVVVDQAGMPIEESLALLRNSGYGLLDVRGTAAVLDSTFENLTGGNMPYRVTVEFPYTGNSCANQETLSESAAPGQ